MIKAKQFFAIITILMIFTLNISITSAQAHERDISVIVSLLLLDGENTIMKNLHISWKRPTLREDNTVLNESDIQTYRIRYKRVDDIQGYHFFLAYPPNLTTNVTLSGKSGDRYEMAISAIDKDGQASDYSEDVFLTF